jgi:hypothetical protein
MERVAQRRCAASEADPVDGEIRVTVIIVRGTSSQASCHVALCRIATPQSNAASPENTVKNGSPASSLLAIVLVTVRGFV